MLIVYVSLCHNARVHLPQYHRCRFAIHVLRADAMFDGIRCVGVLLHHYDAATR